MIIISQFSSPPALPLGDVPIDDEASDCGGRFHSIARRGVGQLSLATYISCLELKERKEPIKASIASMIKHFQADPPTFFAILRSSLPGKSRLIIALPFGKWPDDMNYEFDTSRN